MRKALLPLFASLALCGTATVALIATNARAAQTPHNPTMVAVAAQPAPEEDAAPPQGDGPDGNLGMRDGDRAAHRAQMCKDMFAHKVGEMAFLEAKLSLTGEQAPLFARWKQASLDIAQAHQSECANHKRQTHTPGERPSVVDRMDREETMLKQRVADIDAERPSLSAFYAALTPAQKHEFGRGDEGRPMMRGMMEHRGMMMGMMGRPHPPEMGPPGDHGPDGPPPGLPPGPPPAQ
jgi:hypothetical protein